MCVCECVHVQIYAYVVCNVVLKYPYNDSAVNYTVLS